MNQPHEKKSESVHNMVVSYIVLRRFVGVMGMALPFILWSGGYFLFEEGLQDSISSYYHTSMRDVFVGFLIVIGVFLLSYKGYEKKDDRAGDICCIAAIGVALFPTKGGNCEVAMHSLIGTSTSNILHFCFAGVFLCTLAYFALVLFVKSKGVVTPLKKHRNIIYRFCGTTIILCIISIGLVFLFYDYAGKAVFWLESIAVIAFGISWVIKGETLLRDK